MLKVILLAVFAVTLVYGQLSPPQCIGMFICNPNSAISVDFIDSACDGLAIGDVVPGRQLPQNETDPTAPQPPNTVLVWQSSTRVYYDVRCTINGNPSAPCSCYEAFVFSYGLANDNDCYDPITDRANVSNVLSQGNLYNRRTNDGEAAYLCQSTDLSCFYPDPIQVPPTYPASGSNSRLFYNDWSPANHAAAGGLPREYCECHTSTTDPSPCSVDLFTIDVNPYNTNDAPNLHAARTADRVRELVSRVDDSGKVLPESVSRAFSSFRDY